MEFVCEKKICTGCSACMNVCPVHAITMVLNEKGFFEPAIDSNKCIDCQKCRKTCPAINGVETSEKTKVFAYQNSNHKVRLDSTSGGCFRALAEVVLKEKGAICGAAYDKNLILQHMIIEKKEQLDPLQKSKYVQSNLNNTFTVIKELLDKGTEVLFVGLPCQVAGLSKYLNKKYSNLVLVDLICYGVPSPELFHKWIVYLNEKYKEKHGRVQNIIFRDKSYGYATPNIKVVFENGKEIDTCRDSNIYSNLFFKNFTLRESCFGCRFKSIERVSDITLGDLWLVSEYDKSKDDNNGTTAVFSHTEKGDRLISQISHEIWQLNLNNVISTDAKKIVECTQPSKRYEEFWRDYQNKDFKELIDKYEPVTIKYRYKYFIKRILNKLHLSGYIFKVKKVKRVKR